MNTFEVPARWTIKREYDTGKLVQTTKKFTVLIKAFLVIGGNGTSKRSERKMQEL